MYQLTNLKKKKRKGQKDILPVHLTRRTASLLTYILLLSREKERERERERSRAGVAFYLINSRLQRSASLYFTNLYTSERGEKRVKRRSHPEICHSKVRSGVYFVSSPPRATAALIKIRQTRCVRCVYLYVYTLELVRKCQCELI